MMSVANNTVTSVNYTGRYENGEVFDTSEGKDPDQPAPKFIEDLRANNPGQPTMWTEDQGFLWQTLEASSVS